MKETTFQIPIFQQIIEKENYFESESCGEWKDFT